MNYIDVTVKKDKVRQAVREAVRRFRQRIKENDEKRRCYLESDANRKRKERAKEKEHLLSNKSLLLLKRSKETERKRKYRQRVKKILEADHNKTSSELGSYKCRQSLGKALKKVKRVLPASPNKRKAVIRHLALDIAPDIPYVDKKKNKPGRRPITDDDRQQIIQFFMRDDISRQAPGKRDTKSIKNQESGKRELFQKRHLMLSIKEVYQVFKNEHPEIDIHISKFYEFRPKYILLSFEMPHNVCVCRYHANFNFMVQSINENIIHFPKTSKDLLEIICCDTKSELCMTNKCSYCEYDLSYSVLPLQYNFNLGSFKWKQWSEVNGRPQIVQTEASLQVALNCLEKQIPSFKTHCYVKHIQEQYFDVRKNNLKDGGVVLQVDFAENYSLVTQD